MKRLIIFIGIINVFLLGGCGKDNRALLHSESEDIFSGKESRLFWWSDDINISKSKLVVALAKRLNSVSEVYDVSSELDEGFLVDDWYILFSVRTDEGKVFSGFRCDAEVGVFLGRNDGRTQYLFLEDCHTYSDEGGAKFHDIEIPLGEIISTGVKTFEIQET